MKKALHQFMAAGLLTLCTLPTMAQLNGTGYYRIRNAQHTSDYISLANCYMDFAKIIDAAGGATNLAFNTSEYAPYALSCATAYLGNDIHTVQDVDITNAGAVIYAERVSTSSRYNLISQGTSLLTLTTGYRQSSSSWKNVTFPGYYMTITNVGENMYTASITLTATAIGLNKTLGTRYFQEDDNGKFTISESSSSQNAKWYIEPVTHFNVVPEVELNGKYYTTIKVPFAFTLSGQVEKAYAITAVSNGVLQYQEITGTVPAGTPVILQCGSNDPADCQLIIPSVAPRYTAPSTSVESISSADEGTSYTGTNLLKGTYYCNTDGTVHYNTTGGVNAGSFNGNHYTTYNNAYTPNATGTVQKYVLALSNGKLGFIKKTSGNMPANKAWLEVEGLFPTVDATPQIAPTSGTYSTAQNVTITCSDQDATIVYSTDGGNTWQTYSGTITVSETTTIQAKATKAGLYNDSEVASATYTIEVPEPELTAMPTALAINDDAAGTFTVTGTDLGTDNVGVTRTNTDFVPTLTATMGTATNGQYWYFTPSGGSVQGMVSMTYQGRALRASTTVSVGSYVITADPVEVTYKSNIYIAGDYGDGWSFSNCPQMSENGNTYTATVTITNTNSYIAFVRKATLGENERWNSRYLFTPQSSGNWEMDQNEKGGNINLSGSQPIHFQSPGTYTITIDATDAEHPTFNIVKAEETPLVNIVNDGTVGKQYTIADDVMAIYIASKEPTRVYAKDDNKHRYPTATSTGIDYVKSRARLQSGDWDQSNWVVLEFATAQEASQFVNGNNKGVIRGGTLTGELIDKLNPTMRVTAYQSPSAMQMQFTGYDENNYVTSNFMSELVQTGLVSGNTYFFIQPKAQEYARVNWAMLDGNAHFSVPNNQQGSNSDGLAGSFDADWSLYPGNAATDFETGLTYVFHAIVRYTTEGAALRAPRRDASEGGYVVYPLEGGANTVTAVVENWSDARPVQVKYINAMGVMSDEPFEGLNIVVTRYSDGTTRSSKQAFNK